MFISIKRMLGAGAIALASCFSAGAALAEDSLVVAIQLEPPTLDPTANAAQAIDSVLYSNVFEGLTRFEADGSVVPGLAESWEISEDGLVYTFHLRVGATFHDGSAFDAEDVVFSLDRARAEDSANAQKALFAGILSVEAVDPTTVRVILSAPDGLFLFKMAWGDAVIVAPESAEMNATNPVGTGAFRFVAWVEGDRIELERYDGYWGAAPALRSATFRFISDPSAAFAAMMSGDLDVFAGFPAPENLPLFEADPRFQVLVGATEGETILAMNNAKAPFDDVRVRQAVSLAIDRQAIIDGAMYGVGTPIGTHFAPHHPDYVDLTDLSPYDPERARALLTEAGYPDGFTATLKLPPPSYARRGGEIIAAQLRAVGIETEIVNLEWALWLEEVFKAKDFDLTIVSHTEPMDIGIYAREDYYFQYNNPYFNEVFERLNLTTDPEERSMRLAALQRVIAEDYVNAYLFELAYPTVAKTGVEGIWLNQPTAAFDLTGIRWTE